MEVDHVESYENKSVAFPAEAEPDRLLDTFSTSYRGTGKEGTTMGEYLWKEEGEQAPFFC